MSEEMPNSDATQQMPIVALSQKPTMSVDRDGFIAVVAVSGGYLGSSYSTLNVTIDDEPGRHIDFNMLAIVR